MRYEFGRNWAEFIEKNFSEERIEEAKQHLLGFMKLDSLRGKTMIDIGCGSGLHSLAAHRAGEERILSFDYDPNSVATTLKLREFAGKPSNWEAKQGSVLDSAYMETLVKFDLSYSRGVLHHIGEMWKASANARVTMNSLLTKFATVGITIAALAANRVLILPMHRCVVGREQKVV